MSNLPQSVGQELSAFVQGMQQSTQAPSGSAINTAVKNLVGAGGGLSQSSASIYTPATQDYNGILAAANLANAAGGGIVQLGPFVYDLTQGGTNTTPLPLYQNVWYRGVGCQIGTASNQLSGTVLQGSLTGTSPQSAFAYNSNDLPYWLTFNQFLQYQIVNVRILDLGVQNFAYGLKIGGLYNPGLYNSQIKGVTTSNCTWGFWIENCSNSQFENLNANNPGVSGSVSVPYGGGSFFFCGSGGPAFGTAIFSGYIVGTTLFVTSVSQGGIVNGATLAGSGVVGCTVSTQLSGTPQGVGSYTISVSQTVGSVGSPIAMTTTSTGGWGLNMGNNVYSYVYTQYSQGRNLVIAARGQSAFNDNNFFGVQVDQLQNTVNYAITALTNGSPNITLGSVTGLVVGMPVRFPSGCANFGIYQTYFISSINTGTNQVTVTYSQNFGTNVNYTGSTVSNPGNLSFDGWPLLEMTTFDGLCAIQQSSVYGADLEGSATCKILAQAAQCEMHLTTIAGTPGSDCGSVICTRPPTSGGSHLTVHTMSPLTFDIDPASYCTYYGGQVVDTAGYCFLGNNMPQGTYRLQSNGANVTNFCSQVNNKNYQGNGNGVGSFVDQHTAGGSFIYPLCAMGETMTDFPYINSSGSPLGLNAYLAGTIVWSYASLGTTYMQLPYVNGPITGQNGWSPNSNVGLRFKIKNENGAAGTIVVTTTGGQHFGRTGTKASYTIADGGWLEVLAMLSGSTNYWTVINSFGAT